MCVMNRVGIFIKKIFYMKKIAFIIPGYGFSGKEREYQKIAEFFRQHKIKPVIVEIDWKRRTMSQYVRQFEDQYFKHAYIGSEIYFLGFSYGAMVACIASARLKPKNQILCSLSPYFKEDMPSIKKWWRSMTGKRRIEEFENLSFAKLAKSISARTILLAGDKEGVEVEKRTKDASRKITGSELFFLNGVKHDISDKRYLEKIKSVIEKL